MDSPAFFAAFTGFASFAVNATADATVGASVNCTICFLGSVIAGNADFTVKGGAIAVNGDVTAGPNSVWTSADNQVSGTVTGGQFSSASTTISGFADPLASLSVPPTWSGLTAKADPCTDGPGVYADAVTLSPAKGRSDCALQPGLYVVANTWTLSNNTTLTGKDVTLYARASGGSRLQQRLRRHLRPHGPRELPPWVGILYGRINPNPLALQGNGQTDIDGGIYAAGADIDVNGNSCVGRRERTHRRPRGG